MRTSRGGRTERSLPGLNEVAVLAAASLSMIDIELEIDREPRDDLQR
ncbi:MAG: hypothetical protein U0992_08450 [Planctomycetaceae bacterium]